jgi:glutamine amidotransferase
MSCIGIVDYGKGNLNSVLNAIGSQGANGRIVNRPEDIKACSHIILPGVGAFGKAMEALRGGGWIKALEQHARVKGKPFLGICLGMQLLAQRGTEHGDHEGLGWVPGTVVRLESSAQARIPHIGWNGVEIVGSPMLFAGVESGRDYYFVHSYALRPDDESCVTGWCHHGERFAAAVQHDNIHATQFHPEKSQQCGLAILKNFIQC